MKVITVEECAEQDGQVLYQGKRYIPEGDELRLRLILEHHVLALTGHPGRAKTKDLLDGQYNSKDMRKQVNHSAWNCYCCQHSRASRPTMIGVL